MIHAKYPKGIKVSDADMTTLNIKGDIFHPEWNYTISPRLQDMEVLRGARISSPAHTAGKMLSHAWARHAVGEAIGDYLTPR